MAHDRKTCVGSILGLVDWDFFLTDYKEDIESGIRLFDDFVSEIYRGAIAIDEHYASNKYDDLLLELDRMYDSFLYIGSTTIKNAINTLIGCVSMEPKEKDLIDSSFLQLRGHIAQFLNLYNDGRLAEGLNPPKTKRTL